MKYSIHFNLVLGFRGKWLATSDDQNTLTTDLQCLNYTHSVSSLQVVNCFLKGCAMET